MDTHPELRDGEVFFSNMSDGQFVQFLWDSKRKGSISYNGEGKRLEQMDWFPVFVASRELEERKKDLKEERRRWREICES